MKLVEATPPQKRCNYIHVTKGQCVKVAHPKDPDHLWLHAEAAEPKTSLNTMMGKDE